MTYAWLLAATCALSLLPGYAHAQSTALRFKVPTSQIHYDVKIALEPPGEKSIYQGRITYQGNVENGVTASRAVNGNPSVPKRPNSQSNHPPCFH